MNKEERLKAADEVFDACFDFKEVPIKGYTTKSITNDIKIALNIAINKGAEAEAESNLNAIRKLIETFEEKVKFAEHLKQPTGTWGNTTTAADIERLNIRIYERLIFIDALKAIYPPLNQQ